MLDQLPEPTQFDVVFVTGLHKSGTSALVQVLADRFLDTSRITNPAERGFGRSSPRYLTRECKTVRAINEHYRSNALATVRLDDANHIFDTAALRSQMGDFFRAYPRPVVLKAPFFGYSLHDWLAEAARRGRCSCVCVATRPRRDVINAWRHAPFTLAMLAEGELPRLQRGIWHQLRDATERGVAVRRFPYELLLQWASASAEEKGQHQDAVPAGVPFSSTNRDSRQGTS
jgi:hypothetical protein